jgi:hypothetical protein
LLQQAYDQTPPVRTGARRLNDTAATTRVNVAAAAAAIVTTTHVHVAATTAVITIRVTDSHPLQPKGTCCDQAARRVRHQDHA